MTLTLEDIPVQVFKQQRKTLSMLTIIDDIIAVFLPSVIFSYQRNLTKAGN